MPKSPENAETDGSDRAKVLSVRLTAEEYDELTRQAREMGLGPSTYARTLLHQSLRRSTPDFTFPGARTPAITHELASPASPGEADLETRISHLERQIAQLIARA